jgi:ATP-dependent protease HslVU (ClpYQ) peptidase subunit
VLTLQLTCAGRLSVWFLVIKPNAEMHMIGSGGHHSRSARDALVIAAVVVIGHKGLDLGVQIAHLR